MKFSRRCLWVAPARADGVRPGPAYAAIDEIKQALGTVFVPIWPEKNAAKEI